MLLLLRAIKIWKQKVEKTKLEYDYRLFFELSTGLNKLKKNDIAHKHKVNLASQHVKRTSLDHEDCSLNTTVR